MEKYDPQKVEKKWPHSAKASRGKLNYNPQEVEAKWRKSWSEHKTFQVDLNKAPKPFYNLMMFPYPSGEGLHVGHVFAFGGADSYGRFKRMQAFDVFEPMGFDAFGIHSENFAIKKNLHPKKLIEETTRYFRSEQLEKLGALFDWDHTLSTTDPNYYRWTQWLFIKLYKAKLAIKKEAPVPFCPVDKTVLADEQVINGCCERCGSEVVQKVLSQWFFKITDYAQKLLDNLDRLDWSDTTKDMQKNWIGRSEGVQIEFKVKSAKGKVGEGVEVFTTRPDTLFGATFLVLAPEHPLVGELMIGNKPAADYVSQALVKSEVERLSTVKEKTGVFTGSYAINPVNGNEIPIWIADYVLGSYGTGAIMAVPAHDQRDMEFANNHQLAIVQVVKSPKDWNSNKAYAGQGKLINSGNFSGQNSQAAKKNISKYIEEKQFGSIKVNFHLRDWLISRQRYWGPPIPIIYCHKCWENSKLKTQNSKIMKGWDYTEIDGVEYMIHPVPEKDLPVLLPEVEDFKPLGSGKSPLANVGSFVNTTCPECGEKAIRETDVSDTFLDSSWYFLRYPSVGSQNSKRKTQNGEEMEIAWNEAITKKWLPVDMYIGGNEHAVLHLLYARFITMVLHDLDYLDFEEPFQKFRAHGLIIHGGAKMSKSRGNVINPNEFIEKYGADTLRMYLLFIGPYERGGDFSIRGIGGISRFLNRVWARLENLSKRKGVSDKDQRSLGSEDRNNLERRLQVRQQAITRVTNDLEKLRFNTAIAALMEYLNSLNTLGANQEDLEILIKLLAPLAPHFAEEGWEKLRMENGQSPALRGGEWRNEESVHNQPWPQVTKNLIKEEGQTIIIQINGKVRDRIEVKGDQTEEQVVRLALDRDSIKKYTLAKKILSTHYVAGKVVNFETN